MGTARRQSFLLRTLFQPIEELDLKIDPGATIVKAGFRRSDRKRHMQYGKRKIEKWFSVIPKGVEMREREMREELRRLFIANAMIDQFICDVARSNLAEYEVDRLIEEVNGGARELKDGDEDPWMDLDPSAQRPDKLN
jgi:hypothetical protein